MVNAINLQMTTKNDIATWKANRRKLAYSTVGTPDYVSVQLPKRNADNFEVVLTRLADLTGNLLAARLRQGV